MVSKQTLTSAGNDFEFPMGSKSNSVQAFKKYLTLHVDNSKQKHMADMWFPSLGKSETHCSCL